MIVVLGILWIAAAVFTFQTFDSPSGRALTDTEICERYSYTFEQTANGGLRLAGPHPDCPGNAQALADARTQYERVSSQYWPNIGISLLLAAVAAMVLFFLSMLGKSIVMWVVRGFAGKGGKPA